MNKKIVIRVFTLFSGYDSQIMALRRLEKWARKYHPTLNLQFKIVGWCEIDEAAVKSHNAVYPEYAEPFNSATGRGYYHKDVTKIDWKRVPHFDLLFYSSCCQDISRCGAQRGLEAGTGTRSSLIWYVLNAIKVKKPKYCILENVAALAEQTFIASFVKWQRSVDQEGYRSYWSVLNSANYDIPQNRRRIFMVSIRNDVNEMYSFPSRLQTVRSINSFLEDTVDEKYYLEDSAVDRFLTCLSGNRGVEVGAPTHTHKAGKMVKQIVTPTCRGDMRDKTISPVIPTITATAYNNANENNCYTLGHFPKAEVLEVWTGSNCNLKGSYQKLLESSIEDKEGVKNACADDIFDTIRNLKPGEYLRLRKMSPREQFRFMGVSEDDIDKLVSSGVSDAELYKQAGNSIVVDVLFELFKSLFIGFPLSDNECDGQ